MDCDEVGMYVYILTIFMKIVTILTKHFEKTFFHYFLMPMLTNSRILIVLPGVSR